MTVVGVRPEHFGDAGEGDADLAVSIDVVEHLGGTSFIYATTGPWRRPGDPARRGEGPRHAEITVSIRKSYLFDENGQRLR